jgi:hypothetical protein
LLIEAKAALDRGEWQSLKLPFSSTTAQRLMLIARNQRLANPANLPLLPPHWTTLYDLANRPEERLGVLFAKKLIHPNMTKAPPDEDAYIDKMRPVRLKKVRRASPRKPARPAWAAVPARPQVLPPTAANELLAVAVRLAADLEAWPPNILVAVRLMPIDDRRKLGELADKIVNWWLRMHGAAQPK